VLEPYDGKLSRTVLRGEGASNSLNLPGDYPDPIYEGYDQDTPHLENHSDPPHWED
jgi:hypothetical protein